MAIRINAAARAAQGAARRARTRERLLEAAMEVIATNRGDTTIDLVVEAAGVSRGTFYNYFPTLEDLTHAVADHLAEDARQDLGVRLAHVWDPAAQLAASAHYFLRRTRREPVWAWAALSVNEMRDRDFPSVNRVFMSLHRRGVAAGLFAPRDPVAAHVITAGALRAAQRQVLADDPPFEFDMEVIGMLLQALGVPAELAAAISRETATAAETIEPSAASAGAL
ncbi:MAG: TetR family transcriptional regulator [Phenylobacterium sp.]|uniref:TetR/AcrR family transcriptional regulator n=1 Tax=Phenylobacterium sp. TaxID=1871053 RepID=UPI0025F18CA4|nr:TetR/AcrR family transcriptional regulator [Phenylobacterium sp.]MBI1199361.1 TetR family transcriptional regulator [Phenylobacterium sp.]